MKHLMLLIVVAALSGCAPSCEEQGGRLVLLSMIPITQMVGTTVIVNLVPIYDCELPKK